MENQARFYSDQTVESVETYLKFVAFFQAENFELGDAAVMAHQLTATGRVEIVGDPKPGEDPTTTIYTLDPLEP